MENDDREKRAGHLSAAVTIVAIPVQVTETAATGVELNDDNGG